MPNYPKNTTSTIPYDSPSGEINIGKWLPPFKKLDKGFGFLGVLAEDVGTGKLQCHICGGWYEILTTHIFAKHKINSEKYHLKFGLLRDTALKSKRIRKLQSEFMVEARKTNPKRRMKFKKGNKESANRKGKPKAIESQNKYGVCELQIAEKIIQLRNKLGKTPSLTALIDEYGGTLSTNIHNRFGSYVKLVKKLGMIPVFSSKHRKYSKKYFVKKGVEAVKDGKKLKVEKIFGINEDRALSRYFPSRKSWEKAVLKVVNK